MTLTTLWKRCILILINPSRAIYISNGDHDNPHEPLQIESEGCDISQNTLYSHQINLDNESDDSEKVFYIYQNFQDSEKIHQIESESDLSTTDDYSLYPYANNNIKYGLFEDLVESYYLDSQIKDDFQCDHDCYAQHRELTNDDHFNICTHDYQHITQNIQDLTDNTQQNNLHSMEECASSFTDDIDTHCDYSISDHTSDRENINDTHTNFMLQYPTIHSQRKHAHRDTLAMHTYSTTILITKTCLHFKTNILHYFNKNYKTHTGIYMTQYQPKVPNFQGHGHGDNATCNVLHWRFQHSH